MPRRLPTRLAVAKARSMPLGEGTMFGACTEDKSDGKNVKLNGSSKPAATSTTEKPAEETADESETTEEE